ncbi:MAG: hypothetical protein ABSF82_14530 [Candidatus Bathyarchaeia archaeon]|jgi:DNA-binding transcriptional regulator YhcF (GntR family)
MVTITTSYARNETLLLRYLGAAPILRIVDFFLDNPLSDYSKNEIAKSLAMSRVTFFKYWKELEKSGALTVSRKIGRATLYELDRKNDVVKQLIKLDMALARKSMEQALEENQKPVASKTRHPELRQTLG